MEENNAKGNSYLDLIKSEFEENSLYYQRKFELQSQDEKYTSLESEKESYINNEKQEIPAEYERTKIILCNRYKLYKDGKQ